VVGSFNWVHGLDEVQIRPDGACAVTIGVPYGKQLEFRYLGGDGDWCDGPGADDVTSDGSLLHSIAAP
jgi:hypothetical protein